MTVIEFDKKYIVIECGQNTVKTVAYSRVERRKVLLIMLAEITIGYCDVDNREH